jgi:hypothetical protein
MSVSPPVVVCDRRPAEWMSTAAATEDLFQLLRTVARRDLTVAIAHSTAYVPGRRGRARLDVDGLHRRVGVDAVPTWIAAAPALASRLGGELVGGHKLERRFQTGGWAMGWTRPAVNQSRSAAGGCGLAGRVHGCG